MTEDTFVSISEASQLLGVSEAALRQWTDEGRVKAFITPGGHRRYSRAELRKFMSAEHKTLGTKDLAAGLEETAAIHREIDRVSLAGTTWYNKLNQQAQERLAELGRRMLDVIIRYVTSPSRKEETINQARAVGKDIGATLAVAGIPLIDSVEAFLLHRDPIMNAVTHLMKKREAVDGRVIQAIPSVAHVMDEALVALVAEHQQHRAGGQKPDGGS